MFSLTTRLSAVQTFFHSMNLQARFLLIIGTCSLLLALLIIAMFSSVVERVVERIGTRFAEKQVLYDKARTLQPLITEVALARQMADSAIIKRWAANEQDPQLRASALTEMEKFKGYFHDGSYFMAFAASGNYYFNDASGQYAGKQLRYTLNRANPENAWFYATIKSAGDYHINVDPDTRLGVTKVWINVLLRDGAKVLGVIGTGLEMSEFIHKVAAIEQPGITNLFLDSSGAIQLYRDVGYIDYSSIAKPVDKRSSIDQLLKDADDRAWMHRAIAQTDMDSRTVLTRLVNIKDKHYLAGVAALPEVGWYDVTLMDLDVLLPQRDFLEIALIIGAAMLGVLLIMAFTLRQLVLKPVAKLTRAATHISDGGFATGKMILATGEVGELASQFTVMSNSIQKTQNWLENEIARRTSELVDAKKMLEILLQQEKERRQAQVHLLALMAHEVRNPVAVIGNTAQMLDMLARSEKPEWLPRIENIMIAVRKLGQLMDDVLNEDRIGLTGSGLNRQYGDLNAFCDQLYRSQSARHERLVRFTPCACNAIIDMDWRLIDIAISNLIDNAVKYSPPGSSIDLRVSCSTGQTIYIEVHNHGESISPVLKLHLFKKFIRGHFEEKIAGLGIGLYLVNWIANLHGGYAELAATQHGNTFRLVLPQLSCNPLSSTD